MPDYQLQIKQLVSYPRCPSRISANLGCRPGYPHKRMPRSFLFFRPLLLRQLPHLIPADRWPDLHHLFRRVNLPDERADAYAPAPLPPPGIGDAGRPTKLPPVPILPAEPGESGQV